MLEAIFGGFLYLLLDKNNTEDNSSLDKNTNNKINYGFNGNSEWGITSIGDKKVQYGYIGNGSAWGPVAIGDMKIRYGFDGNGNWAPKELIN